MERLKKIMLYFFAMFCFVVNTANSMSNFPDITKSDIKKRDTYGGEKVTPNNLLTLGSVDFSKN